MKKTLTVNLNNIVFHIDDDAYEMLQTYLHEIADHFEADEEKAEIMNDIEARIAELFTEKLQKSKNVVNLLDVQEIIEVMGKPSQYTGEDEEEDKTPKAPKSEKKQQSRRFYRDPENAILGGVGGGLAAYFGLDVTIVRVILAFLVIVSSGTFIPIYIIMWFVAPVAVTASQRLEMQGEDVNIDSIKTELNNAKNYVESDKFKQTASTVGDKIFTIIRLVVKVVLGFIGAILGIVGVVVVAALIFLLFFLIFEPTFFNSFAPGIFSNWGTINPDNAIMIFISLILVIGCPIFMLIYWGVRAASGKYNGSKTASLVVLILWIAGLFMFYSVGASTFIRLHHNGEPFNINWSRDDNSNLKDEVRSCDAFTAIEISGNIELTLKQDSTQQVTVSSQEDILPRVITKVENGVLKIYTDNIFIDRNIKVVISTPGIKNIIAKGACKIKTDSLLTVPELSLELLGACEVDMNVAVAGLFTVDAKGASEAQLEGSCDKFKLSAVGASEIKATELKAKNVEVYAAGASDTKVFATESIDAKAYGASDIDCQGSPKTIKQSDGGASSINIE